MRSGEHCRSSNPIRRSLRTSERGLGVRTYEKKDTRDVNVKVVCESGR